MIEKLLTNKLLRFIIPGIIFIIALMMYREHFSMLHSTVQRHQCERRKEIRAVKIQGVILSKYKDFRELRYVKYLDGKDTIELDIFVVEGSTFYEYLNVGDTIKKDVGSLDFKVKALGKDSTHKLIYGCE